MSCTLWRAVSSGHPGPFIYDAMRGLVTMLILLSCSVIVIVLSTSIHLSDSASRPVVATNSSTTTTSGACKLPHAADVRLHQQTTAPESEYCIRCRGNLSHTKHLGAMSKLRRCTLPLRLLLKLPAADLMLTGSGVGLRVESRREPWRSCGAHHILRQVLSSHLTITATSGAAVAPPLSASGGCALQRAVQRVASVAAEGSAAPFTFLQDCAAAPCCPALLHEFAADHPRAAVFAVDLGSDNGALAVSPPNLWTLAQDPPPAADPSESYSALVKRRAAARRCSKPARLNRADSVANGGWCFSLQVAHVLQGHPLLWPDRDATQGAATGRGSTAHTSRSLLWSRHDKLLAEQQWMGTMRIPDKLAANAQEQRLRAVAEPVMARAMEHAALMKAARLGAGATRARVVRTGRPDRSSASDQLEHSAFSSSTDRLSANFRMLGDDAPGGGESDDSGSNVGHRGGSVDSATEPDWPRTEAEAEVEISPLAASAHPGVLGAVLGSAERTLLLMPAAEAMVGAIDAAERAGLLRNLARQLRALLPYRSGRGAESSLCDAMAVIGQPPPRVEKVAGEAQREAHARGHLLLVVRPQGFVTRGNAFSRPWLELSTVIDLGLTPVTQYRLREELARAPLWEHTSQDARRWRVEGGRYSASGTSKEMGDEGELRSRQWQIGGQWGGKADKDSSVTGSVSIRSPDTLDDALWAARDIIDALTWSESELRRRGLCASPAYPLVLVAPRGPAGRTGACAVASDATLPLKLEGYRREASSRCHASDSGGGGPAAPRVLCADGVCRHTFVHCHRALYSMNHARRGDRTSNVAKGADDLLRRALPACAPPERRRRLEAALPWAAELLAGLVSFDRTSRELFPKL